MPGIATKCLFSPKNAVLAPSGAKNEEKKGIWETKRRYVKVLEQGRINFEMVAKRGQTFPFAVIPQGTNRKWVGLIVGTGRDLSLQCLSEP